MATFSSSVRNVASTASLRQPFQRLAILLVTGQQGLLEPFAPSLTLRWHDDQCPAIGRDVQRSLLVDIQQVQDGAVNHQSQAIAMLAESLGHHGAFLCRGGPSSCYTIVPPFVHQGKASRGA